MHGSTGMVGLVLPAAWSAWSTWRIDEAADRRGGCGDEQGGTTGRGGRYHRLGEAGTTGTGTAGWGWLVPPAPVLAVVPAMVRSLLVDWHLCRYRARPPERCHRPGPGRGTGLPPAVPLDRAPPRPADSSLFSSAFFFYSFSSSFLVHSLMQIEMPS